MLTARFPSGWHVSPLSSHPEPLSIASILPLLLRPDGSGPAAFDKRQHGPDFGVRKHVLIGWHGAAIAWRSVVFAAVLNNLEEPLVGMVPGMAGLIVRW